MMRPVMIAGLLALGACAAPGSGPMEPGAPAWQCDAAGAESLIGSHRGAVTFPVDANVRFVCSDCAMTQDYRPDRLTIIFDEDTGIIEQVRCV